MKTYHKIQTVWLRDPSTNHKALLEGEWAKPEFGYLADCPWVFTEKVDGTNVRLLRDGTEVRGKTDAAQLYPGLLNACQDIVQRPAFSELPESMVLYGEGHGSKIQKGGGNYRSDQGFVLFDVWCGMWLERASVVGIAASIGVEVVPIIGEAPLNIMVDWCRSAALTSQWGDFPAEGIVARPQVEMLNRRGERIITKLKCKDFPAALAQPLDTEEGRDDK